MPAVIGPYPRPSPPTYQDYDPRAPAVAARLAALLHERLPETPVEHVGSTAIPGCAGKGVIDLALLYRSPRDLEAINAVLYALGFQDQRNPQRHPESRPMRLGTLAQDGDAFLVHVHVLPAESGELAALCAFRDRLRGDRGLTETYMAQKRAIIAAGFISGIDYTVRKGRFVEAVLAGDADG
jgi:GrpB-like predicted nucleotidyltransferase (UPF0157 family)